MITRLPWVENKSNLYISDLTKHSLRVASHKDFSTKFFIVIYTHLFKSWQLTKVKFKQNLRKYIFEKHCMGMSLSNLHVCWQESKLRSKTSGSCLNMLPSERSVSLLLPNDPKRCANKHLPTWLQGRSVDEEPIQPERVSRKMVSESRQLGRDFLTLQMQGRLWLQTLL